VDENDHVRIRSSGGSVDRRVLTADESYDQIMKKRNCKISLAKHLPRSNSNGSNREEFEGRIKTRDIPPIFIDGPCMYKLPLLETETEEEQIIKPCMPVRVYRKPFSVLVRIFDDLSTPVVITVAIVAIEAYGTLGPLVTSILILFGATWAISTSVYRTRKSGGGPPLFSKVCEKGKVLANRIDGAGGFRLLSPYSSKERRENE
jgi:hypothetical protein